MASSCVCFPSDPRSDDAINACLSAELRCRMLARFSRLSTALLPCDVGLNGLLGHKTTRIERRVPRQHDCPKPLLLTALTRTGVYLDHTEDHNANNT